MSAAMWKKLVEDYLQEPSDITPSKIAEGLQNGSIQLLECMEHLGPSLTNTDTSIRGCATKLIADILHNISSSCLSNQEVGVLTRFLCEKLCDHHSIQPPTLHALAALVTFDNLPDGCSEQICRQIFREVQNQSLSQVDRRSVYNIINSLLSTKLAELQTMKSDFVHGYIQTMDAEKDPRNLILAFQISKTVILNFSLVVFVEEMFEVISCYFPVSFTPPPDNPHGITKEDLVLSLRACLASTPLFGEYCLPLLLEKLTSDIQSAKIDSLQTLAECASVYGSSALKEYISSFYSCIRKEVVEEDSEQVKYAGLNALSAIISTLSSDISDIESPSVLKSYIEEILAEYRVYLLKSDVKILYSTSSLLHCICRTSSIACCMVLTTVISAILLQYYNQTQILCRRCLIDILNRYITCASSHNTDSVLSIVQSHKTDLLKTYTDLITTRDKDMSCHGIQGVAAIFNCRNVLTEKEADELGHHLVKILLNNKDKTIRCETVSALKILSQKFTDVVKTSILPNLIDSLKYEKMDIEAEYHLPAEELLSIIADISNQVSLMKDVCDLIFLQLTNNNDKLCSNAVLTQSLYTMINNNKLSSDVIQFTIDSILPRILQLIQHHYTTLTSTDIQYLASIYRITMATIDNSASINIVKQIIEVFLHNSNFQPLKKSSVQERRLQPILSAVICSLHKSESLPDKEIILADILALAVNNDDDEAIDENSIKCLAGLINKLPESDVNVIISKVEEYIKPVFTQDTTCKQNERCILLLAWVTKSLVLRNHPTGKVYFEKLISLLSNSTVGHIAADSFIIILSEYEDILNRTMKADIKMFYQQRLFVEHCGQILNGYNQSDNSELKKNFLIALSHLIKPLPKHVFLSELPPLLPLLINSLVYEDENLLQLTLATIQTLCADDSGSVILCNQLQAIIPQLLKLSQYQKNMQIRMSALKCLKSLTKLPVHFLLPYRNSVTRTLQPVLDDRKRLVRGEAVTARTAWFLIAEPGS
ncbi:MMS19 nucleotide excision repair protein homolog isoform X1 [Patella vulgata]|uniref:MMS19 nucleotide excision repair protein homolog isoform X1 n=1 Tax=Patella vulgata TaxID=6465 RepID=UPI0024A84C0A|nr:MMS19 nucleotide excision repair protein homolog isoform X1 [Patella vulgata]